MKTSDVVNIQYSADYIPETLLYKLNEEDLELRSYLDVTGDEKVILTRIHFKVTFAAKEKGILRKNINHKYSGEAVSYCNIAFNGRINVDRHYSDFAPMSFVSFGDIPMVYINDELYAIAEKNIGKLEKLILQFDFSPKLNEDAFNRVFWNKKTSILKNDVTFFANSYDWFISRDIPFNRSYLLYGEPGNGKTMAIRSIANFFNTSPETFDFSARYMSPDTAFLNWMVGKKVQKVSPIGGQDNMGRELYIKDNEEFDDDECEKTEECPPCERKEVTPKTPYVRLLVLEDLDRHYPKDGKSDTSISLSSILNALDGADSRGNTIVVATANSPENLDQKVLLRPGRFDRRICFEPPTIEQAISFLGGKFKDGDIVSKEMLHTVADKLKGHSYALFNELFISSASIAFQDKRRNIKDVDLEMSCEEHLSFILDVLKKRGKDTMGFGA